MLDEWVEHNSPTWASSSARDQRSRVKAIKTDDTLARMHDGAEAGLVMSGDLELWVGEQHFRLHAGDSFAFESTEPHRCANSTCEPAKVLWVITPPHY